jgi:hypothetical protein
LKRAALLVAMTGVLVAAGSTAVAGDYVIVRGAYYREASTRVIQPMVELERESPSGIDVGAHFLVDAITSASIAAGTTVDSVFTEVRDEAGLRVRKRWTRSDATIAYRYSAESDYWSHGIGASYGRRFWGDTGALRLSVGRGFDTMSARGRTPECRPGMSALTCPLDTWYAGINYTQILSPVWLAQVSYELAYLDGFQGNLYRAVPNFGYEVVPDKRLRHAVAARTAYYFPQTGTGVQLLYRHYWDAFPGGDGMSALDPWALRAETIEGRLYQHVTSNFELRLLFRYHWQNNAQFWCNAVAVPGCYAPGSFYYSTDPKLGGLVTKYPELKVVWEAGAMRDLPFFKWFAGGSFEVSYGYFLQTTSFGGAHLLQAGYRLPY